MRTARITPAGNGSRGSSGDLSSCPGSSLVALPPNVNHLFPMCLCSCFIIMWDLTSVPFSSKTQDRGHDGPNPRGPPHKCNVAGKLVGLVFGDQMSRHGPFDCGSDRVLQYGIRLFI